MPSYDYACRDCGKEFTVYHTLAEEGAKLTVRCPHCESDNVHKKITAFFAKTSRKS